MIASCNFELVVSLCVIKEKRIFFLDDSVKDEILNYWSYDHVCIKLSAAIPVDSASCSDCVLQDMCPVSLIESHWSHCIGIIDDFLKGHEVYARSCYVVVTFYSVENHFSEVACLMMGM